MYVSTLLHSVSPPSSLRERVRVFPDHPSGIDPKVEIDNTSLRMLILVLSKLNGAVAQLGERLNGIQEADGSIPFSSTI